VECGGSEASDGWESQQGSRVQDLKSIDTWDQFSSLGPEEGRTREAGVCPGRGDLLASPRFQHQM
jgi:hypothetical protein